MNRPAKASEISKSFDDHDDSEGAPPRDISELPEAITSLHIRSIALTGIFLLMTFYTLKLASAFFIPVVLAMLLSFLFASTIRTLQRFWVPPPLGAVLVVGCLLGGLGVGIYRLALPARDWMAKLPEAARQIEGKLKDVKQSVREVTKAGQEVDRLTNLGTGEKTQKIEVRKPSLGESMLEPTQDILVGGGIVFVLLFFLLASGDTFLRKLVTVLPRFEDKKAAVEISRQIEQDISTYLLAITVVNAVFGLAVATAMFFLGMPNPLLWGVMAGLLHFIPFLGAVIGISVVTLVAAVTLDGIGAILLVPTAYFSLNIIEEYIVLPLVMGRRLMLNPVVVLIWLIFWTWLWGVPGALMAVPLLAIVKIICEHVEPLGAFAEFIEG
ncbi:MAG TPA: AI-2E family transporter [Candidatus Binatia bacterium]